MIALDDGTTLLELHRDLYWSDEDSWHPVGQNVVRTLTGALDIQSQAMQKGRPITLESDDTYAWMHSSAIEQLRTWAAQPLLKLNLQLRGTTREVIFRHHEGAMEATCILHYNTRVPTDWYVVVLRLMEV